MKKLIIFLIVALWGQNSFAAYSYYRTVVVDHTKVSTNDQTQFPILVCGNGSSPCNASISGLNQSGAGAHVTNSSGFDIIFTTDSGCTNKLTWEMEKYVSSTGEFEAWVTNTSTALSHTADTTFYMCYGNSSISSFQSTASSVWDSNYVGVWHFPDGTTLGVNDSTAGGFNGTLVLTPTATTGQLDGGMANTCTITAINNCKSSTAYVTTTIKMQTQVSGGNATVEWWLNPSFSPTDGNDYSFWGQRGQNGTPLFQCERFTDNNWYCGWNNGTDARVILAASSSNLTQNTWQSYALTVVSGGTTTLYRNATSIGTHSSTGTGSPAGAFAIGGCDESGNGVYGYNGSIDEFRISKITRGSDWITTEYNNENSPSTFYTLGSEAQSSHLDIIQGGSIITGSSTIN